MTPPATPLLAHRAITALIVPDTFRTAGEIHGHPAATLPENGMVYTVRFATGLGGRTAWKASRPNGRPDPHHDLDIRIIEPPPAKSCVGVGRILNDSPGWFRPQIRPSSTLRKGLAILEPAHNRRPVVDP